MPHIHEERLVSTALIDTWLETLLTVDAYGGHNEADEGWERGLREWCDAMVYV